MTSSPTFPKLIYSKYVLKNNVLRFLEFEYKPRPFCAKRPSLDTSPQVRLTAGQTTHDTNPGKNMIHATQLSSAPLLTNTKEAGRLLGIGQTKVYELLNRRELPFVKIGKSTRIELAAIYAFIDRQRIGS
jgi:excisionase family DNA binding protein